MQEYRQNSQAGADPQFVNDLRAGQWRFAYTVPITEGRGMADGPRSPELRSILISTRLGELTLPSWPTLTPQDSAAAAAKRMQEEGHGSALVCSEGRLVGIFTERDLLRVIDHGGDLGVPLSEVMTSSPRTVTTETTLFEATQLMDEGGYRRLPVVDGDGRAVGIVDVKTVTHFLVEHFPAAVYNQASHAQLHARHPEGA